MSPYSPQHSAPSQALPARHSAFKPASRPALLLAFALLLLIAAPAFAQQKERVIEGTVTDHAGAPVSNAIVYLKNGATLSIKSYITSANGYFRFGQVPMDADFQVWAEAGGLKSNTKNISGFDSKPNWTIPLRLAPK